MACFTPCPPVPAEPGAAVVVLITGSAVAQTANMHLPLLEDLPENMDFHLIGHIGNLRCCCGNKSKHYI